MSSVSWSLRCLLKAEPGRTYMCADYSNIEGRMLSWLAGETWKLEAFRALDAGTGHDLYKLAYAKSFGVNVEDVTKPQRQIGKVDELALGYQGAHGAWVSMAANYDIDLNAVAAAVQSAVKPGQWSFALERYWDDARETAEEILACARVVESASVEFGEDEAEPIEDVAVLNLAAEIAKKNRHNLSAEVWAAIRIVVDSWRAEHTATTQFWKDLQDAAVAAVTYPGQVFSAGQYIKYRMDGTAEKPGEFLYCRLPSGRTLCYPYARLTSAPDQWGRTLPKVEFEGVDGKTKRWCRQRMYGGLQAENVTQAAARDILSDAIKRLERAGLPVVMHVHDEIVCEVPIEQSHRFEEFKSLMSELPAWAAGLPVAVSGWQGERYRK